MVDDGHLRYSLLDRNVALQQMHSGNTSITALRVASLSVTAIIAPAPVDVNYDTRMETLITAAADNGTPHTLRGLWLYNQGMTSLPAVIGWLTDLEELKVANNIIREISVEVGNLHALRVLILYNNVVETMPDELGKLTNLQQLWLEYNRLVTLPATCSSLTGLIDLTLRGNPLYDAGAIDVANIFHGQTKLVKLNLQCCYIDSVGVNHIMQLHDHNPQLVCLQLEGGNPGYPAVVPRLAASGRGNTFFTRTAASTEIRRQLIDARDMPEKLQRLRVLFGEGSPFFRGLSSKDEETGRAALPEELIRWIGRIYCKLPSKAQFNLFIM